jgi:hypothetical protein
MADTVPTTTTMGNDNDDWEVAVDTGEFDKRLEQQERARAANQVHFFYFQLLIVLKINEMIDDLIHNDFLNFINFS